MPCPACNNRGYMPERKAARVSVADMRLALEAGRVALCTCSQGQWWLSMIYDVYGSLPDRNGVDVGNPAFRQANGVPPGMLHGADALAWLREWPARATSLFPPNGDRQLSKPAIHNDPSSPAADPHIFSRKEATA